MQDFAPISPEASILLKSLRQKSIFDSHIYVYDNLLQCASINQRPFIVYIQLGKLICR